MSAGGLSFPSRDLVQYKSEVSDAKMFYSINMLRKKVIYAQESAFVLILIWLYAWTQDGLYAVVWLHATNQRVSKKMAQSANVPELAYVTNKFYNLKSKKKNNEPTPSTATLLFKKKFLSLFERPHVYLSESCAFTRFYKLKILVPARFL